MGMHYLCHPRFNYMGCSTFLPSGSLLLSQSLVLLMQSPMVCASFRIQPWCTVQVKVIQKLIPKVQYCLHLYSVIQLYTVKWKCGSPGQKLNIFPCHILTALPHSKCCSSVLSLRVGPIHTMQTYYTLMNNQRTTSPLYDAASLHVCALPLRKYCSTSLRTC